MVVENNDVLNVQPRTDSLKHCLHFEIVSSGKASGFSAWPPSESADFKENKHEWSHKPSTTAPAFSLTLIRQLT